ncbi:hypothetical protein [Pseudomonas svalbardensis]|uniref:hypothetical protein n=1 Tax=Pseudomonas svalbardensis TaxID=3042029 RepID=UPI0024B3529C|nr:hypothetical protein [Pseudomonas sp. PMCC200367]
MRIVPLAFALCCLCAQAQEIEIDGPRFDEGKYVIANVDRDGTQRTVTIKRTGPYFTTYIKERYDCSNSTYRLLGTGTTNDNIIDAGLDEPWFGVSAEDWRVGLKNYVCLSTSQTTASM